jgi:hypothetical protein
MVPPEHCGPPFHLVFEAFSLQCAMRDQFEAVNAGPVISSTRSVKLCIRDTPAKSMETDVRQDRDRGTSAALAADHMGHAVAFRYLTGTRHVPWLPRVPPNWQ